MKKWFVAGGLLALVATYNACSADVSTKKKTPKGLSCGTELIDFEDNPLMGTPFAVGDTVSNQYQYKVVIFSLDLGLPRIIDNATDPTDAVPTSGVFLLGGNPTTGISNANSLTINFLRLVSNVGLNIIDAETGSTTVTFFDVASNQLDQVVLSGAGSGVAQAVTSTAQDISMIKIDNTDPGDGFFVDDLEFDTCN